MSLPWCVDHIREALGLPNFEARVLDVAPWDMSAYVAYRFSLGRIFWIGDAAHTVPPCGPAAPRRIRGLAVSA